MAAIEPALRHIDKHGAFKCNYFVRIYIPFIKNGVIIYFIVKLMSLSNSLASRLMP